MAEGPGRVPPSDRTLTPTLTARERNEYENMATLYTIIIATEHLGAHGAQDAITQLARNTSRNATSSWRNSRSPSSAALAGGQSGQRTTEAFGRNFIIDGSPRAVNRLLRMGVPEPIKSTAGEGQQGRRHRRGETVQHFITTSGRREAETRAVDELQPCSATC
ncbi:hypothetical protein ACHAW5_002260 [Stephanodiscus triporus]|uniref:Uncharacterized protein n=1 Tax=Stephanodiscus triporus TaxID=2934178 RepID=A0ABD3MF53_9STRA